MARKRIAIVGAGRVGQTLARALRRRGWRIGAVVTRRPSSARTAARFIGAGQPVSDVKSQISKLDSAGIFLVTTNDNQVSVVARALARLKKNWRGRVVLQASGALSSRVLAPLGRRGASVGSLHPLYPFPKPLKNFPPGVVFGVEGEARALREALALVRSLRGEPMEVRSTEKALYHAAAALVAGHLLTLADLGVRALVRAGVRKSRARTALVPLAQATLGWYARHGARAWTGPLARGDVDTVRRHLAELRKLPPQYGETYRALARAALALYRKRSSKDTKKLRRLLE
ncbi:MAG TPA: Rossmann-like and DUF2520 domain-containing protein [Candidatus Xenobia bacterium]|nr:Rossmann-like and DUF2520 domain-containing protein [Candidatus Xenobia bacterium]